MNLHIWTYATVLKYFPYSAHILHMWNKTNILFNLTNCMLLLVNIISILIQYNLNTVSLYSSKLPYTFSPIILSFCLPLEMQRVLEDNKVKYNKIKWKICWSQKGQQKRKIKVPQGKNQRTRDPLSHSLRCPIKLLNLKL